MKCYGPVGSRLHFFFFNEMTWLGSQKVDEHGKINEFDETFAKVVDKFMKAKQMTQLDVGRTKLANWFNQPIWFTFIKSTNL